MAITYVSGATPAGASSTSRTISTSGITGIAVGDLVIAVVTSEGSTTHNWTTAQTNGWTKAGEFAYATNFTVSWGWITYSGATASSAVSVSAGNVNTATMSFAYRGTSKIAPIGATSSSSGSTINFSSTGITTTRANSVAIYLSSSAIGGGGCAQPTGWTERFDQGISTYASFAIGDKTVATSGSGSGDIAVTGGGHDYWVQYQIELLEDVPELPRVIAGISTAVAPVGPFKVAAGNYPGALIYSTGSEGGSVNPNTFQSQSQSITVGASNIAINQVKARLGGQNPNTATGTVQCVVRSGSNTGTIVATSTNSFDVSAFGAGTTAYYTFNFTEFTLSSATQYFVQLVRSGTGGILYYRTTSDLVGETNYKSTDNVAWVADINDVWFQFFGNYVLASDVYYFFGRDGTTATTLQAFKSTAPDTSWASIATKTGFTTAILNIASCPPVGSVIHLTVQDGTMSSSVATKYLSFDATTDTFLATTETVAAAVAITGSAASGWGCSLVVRSSGQAVIFYNGLQTKTSGTFYARNYYRVRTGLNTYSTETAICNTSLARDVTFPIAVLGLSDRSHLVWYESTANTPQRTLSSANVLSASVISGGATSQPLDACSVNDGGAVKHVAFTASATTRWTSADSPTLTAASITFGTPVRTVNDGTDVYALYQNSGDSDLYVKKSTDFGATFGSGISAFTGTVAAVDINLSRNQTAYERSSKVVFPYIVNDAGLLKYNEYVIRTLAAPVSLVASNLTAPTPVFGTPVLTEVIPPVSLTATNLTAPAPVIETAAMTQKHVVTATSYTSPAPVIGTAALTQTHTLTPTNYTSPTPVIANALLTQKHVLASTSLTAPVPVLGTPALSIVITGSLDTDDAADDATLDGTVEWLPVTGTITAPETADDATLAGNVAWLTALDADEAADDATITSTVAWLTALDTDETADDATLAGTVAWLATFDTDETADDATIAGGIYGTGELDADEAADDATITASVAWLALLDTNETADDATITAVVAWRGPLAVTEPADDATFTGTVAWSALLDTDETADDATFAANVAWVTFLDTDETADDATFTGNVTWLTALATSETADDATFTGGIYGTGTLVVSEDADSFVGIGGIVGEGLAGWLDAFETADDATLTGQVTGVAGTLTASEIADDATITASVAWLGPLAANETADDATLSGNVAWQGSLAASETADDATFAGTTAWLGTLTVTEAPDDATFTGSVFVDLAGQIAPAVTFAGSSITFAIDMAGGFAPSVSLAGSAGVIRSLDGDVAPAVTLNAGLTVVSAFGISGELVPSIDLAGDLTTINRIAGGLAPTITAAADLTIIRALAGDIIVPVSFAAVGVLVDTDLEGDMATLITFNATLSVPTQMTTTSAALMIGV